MNFDPTGGPMAPPSQEEVERRNTIKHKKPRSIVKLTVLLFVLGLFAGAGAYFVTSGGSEPATDEVASNTTPTQQPTEQQSPSASGNDVPVTTQTKNYENSPLGLKFIYPDTWKTTDTEDKGVRVESPEFSFVTKDAGTVKGYFRIYIRKGARAQDGVVIGKGVAIQPSEKLVYTQPALNQRKDTLLSLFGLNSADNFNFFMIAGNFALNVGDSLGPDYGSEPDAFIVGGGFSGSDLTGDLSMHSVDISTLPTSEAYKQAKTIIGSLQLR